MKGIVFEITGNQAVLMKNGGGFAKVQAKEHWAIGDVVEVVYPFAVRKRVIGLAASLLLLFSFGTGGYYLYAAPISLVSVDVNPSIEISLNRFDRVIGLKAHNTQAKEILDTIQLNNMHYNKAVELLMQDGQLGRYLEEGGYLVISVQANNQQKQQLLMDQMQLSAKTILSHHENVTADFYTVSGNTVEEAHAHGVTAGKYMLLMELTQASPDIDIYAYSHCTISEIKEQINAHGSGCIPDGQNSTSEHGGRHH